jgi:hypothetical protein
VKEAEKQATVIEIPEAVETQVPVQEVKSQIPAVEVQDPPQKPIEPIDNAPLPIQEPVQKVISPSPELPVVGEAPQQPIAVNSEL